MNVAICDYGAGNVRSVEIAFARLGARFTDDVERTPTSPCSRASARRARAMEGLRRRGLDEALRERVADGRRVLGICLGLQLALDESEEDGGVEGLGLVPGRAVRLREGRIPRIGWAEVDAWGETFYFAHSYAAETPCATARSEGVVAVAERGAFVGVQFHPEKSGAAGARFLESRASPSPDPVPRRRGRPRRQGRALRRACATSATRSSSAARTRTPAPTSSSSSTSPRRSRTARTLVDLVGRVAERLAIPFTVGGGIRTVADAEALLRPARTRSPSTPRRSSARSS